LGQPGNIQLNDFQARLARIGSGDTHLADGLVDREMVEYAQAGKGRSGKKYKKAAKARVTPKFKFPGKNVVVAFLIGLVAILGGRVTAFQFDGMVISGFDLPGKVVSAMGPYGLAAAFLFVIMVGLGLRDKPHVIGIVTGCVMMLFGEPYAASQAPGAWSKMYSADHVDGMLVSAGLRDVIVPGLGSIAGDTSNLPKVTTPKYKYSSGALAPGKAVPGSAATLPVGVPVIEIPRLKN
jgi:hypothetical protein